MYYDKNARAVQYAVSEKVIVLQTQPVKALSVKYTGLYSVLKPVSPVDYMIDFAGRHRSQRVIHVNMLRQYNKRVEFVGSVRQSSLESVLIRQVEGEEDMEATLLDTPVPVDFEQLLGTSHLSHEQGVEFRAMLDAYKDVISDKPG